MAAPFLLKNAQARGGLLRRLTGNKERAVDEINNVFARSSSLSEVAQNEVIAACEKHGAKLGKLSPESRSSLYEKYAAFAFRDKKVTDDELASLSQLQRLLDLSDDAVQRAYWDPVLELFGKEVDALIGTGRLNEVSQSRLRQVQKDLRIPAEPAKRIYDARAGKKVEECVKEIVEDKKISPEEEKELQEMCRSLDVRLDWGDLEHVYARFKENWQLEYGPLQPVDTEIKLQKRESCFATRDVAWHETRRRTTRVGYSGPTARLRIMKGVYWRVGNVGVQRVSEDVMTHIDSGTVYLTTKRLIFMGTKGNKTIRFPKILDYEIYSNGLSIQKDAGESPFLEFQDQPEQFGACCSVG